MKLAEAIADAQYGLDQFGLGGGPLPVFRVASGYVHRWYVRRLHSRKSCGDMAEYPDPQYYSGLQHHLALRFEKSITEPYAGTLNSAVEDIAERDDREQFAEQ